MPPVNNRNAFDPSALCGACLAVLISLPLAAWLGGEFGTTYDRRVLIYCSLLFWVVAGAVGIFLVTLRAEHSRLTPGRVLLWVVSAWLWPIPVLMALKKRYR